MTKDELIVKQQLEIEYYREQCKGNKIILDKLYMRFFAIGQPLNDNVLKFNPDQIKWALITSSLIEDVETNIL